MQQIEYNVMESVIRNGRTREEEWRRTREREKASYSYIKVGVTSSLFVAVGGCS